MPKVLQMLATYQTGGAQRVALSIAEATGSTVAYDSLDADGLSAFGCIAEKKNIPTVQLDYNAESVIEYMKREGFEVLHIHWCNWPKDSKFEQKKVLMAGFPVVITAHGRKPVPTVPGVALVSVAKGQAEGQANGSILIPNGFELAEFARVERDYSEVKRVGFASRLDGKLEPSMPSILSEAVADKGIELVVIGGGVHKDKFEGQAKRTGRKFAFEGMRGDMPEALSCLDLFVYPTQHDVSPTVVIEAMASGLPVVAPPVGDLPQMLADGRGFCVPFAQMRETVERLLVDETLRRETGERARAYALSTYPAEKMAESYTRLYGKLAELHRQRDEKQEVSIIIPTYRRPQLAYRAAVAALAQDIPVEVIVVNDGDLVSDYSCVKSLPVHFVQLKENSGLSGARNAGMQAARGEYVGFCDDDDLWTPQFARMLKSTLKRSKASIGAYGRGYETLPGGAKKAIYTQRFDSKLLLKRNYIQPSATMFRREELLGLGGFDEAMHRGGMHGPEDWELWLRLTSKGLKMTLCECGGLVYGGNTPNRLTNTAITTGAMNRGYDYIESKLGVKLGIRRH
jgi:glycosyltransferase involved in cell wall biosynthesis